MIDYRCHVAALDALSASLASISFADPEATQRQSEQLADIAASRSYAMLGSLVDHLLVHAASDGVEVGLLERAADLWGRCLALFASIGGIRADLESALDNPTDPASAGKYNDAADNLRGVASSLHALRAEADVLKADVAPLKHLRPHPRQQDESIENWDWGNLFCGRRTEAFVRAVYERADKAETRAFAFGVLASYAGNVAGSAYLGHVVGGSRRAHRYRDRLARNAAGSSIASTMAGLPGLDAMASAIRFGGSASPVLPAALQDLLTEALSETYDPQRSPQLPDLQLGYRRLVRHLQLLDKFKLPAPPAMPSGGFVTRMYGDPANPPPSIRPQSVGVTVDSGGGVSVGTNEPGSPTPDKTDSKKSSGASCGLIIALIILFIILLVVSIIECGIQWAKGEKCNFFEELGDRIKDLFKEGTTGTHGILLVARNQT